MILFLEIILTIYGLKALVTAKHSLHDDTVLNGWRARVVGVIGLMTYPVLVVAALALNLSLATTALAKDPDNFQLLFIFVEWGLMISWFALFLGVSNMLYKSQRAEAQEVLVPTNPEPAGYQFDDPFQALSQQKAELTPKKNFGDPTNPYASHEDF